MADTDDRAQLRTGSTANGRSEPRADVALTQGNVANGPGPRSRGAKRESDEIVAEIERTRENLARTIDALTEKVSPANNVRKLREQIAEQVARPEVILGAAAVGLAVVGFAIYRIWGRRRR